MFLQLGKTGGGDVDMDSEGVTAQQGASGNAHRSAIRIVGGQRVGDLARPLPTGPRCHNVAGGQPCSGTHMPAVGRAEITGGLQMFGNQRGIFISRCRVT